jgi:two-component system response regulator HydG
MNIEMVKEKILIVEDEYIVANDLRMMLTKAGYEVCGIASSVIAARTLVGSKKPDYVLLDIFLKGDLTGIDLAWELKELQIPFLYISANTNQTTMELVKETQPYGFMVKPFRERDLLVMLDIARYKNDIEKGNKMTVRDTGMPEKMPVIEGVIGTSAPLLRVLEKVMRVSPTQTSVLILGESGTGKERIAHVLHELSGRKNGPFITVNCTALPESLIESELFGHEKGAFTGAYTNRTGKFEQANRGTIFLDEIGELPLDSQAKLLRVLQEKEIEKVGGDQTIRVDVRVIAATNRNLETEVGQGRFRLDLYYRLNVFPVQLPPLRERAADIEMLTLHFLNKYSLKNKFGGVSISDKALNDLKNYNWPGNIRELEHLIERSVLLSNGHLIDKVELPKPLPTPQGQNSEDKIKTIKEMEREHIMHALSICEGRVFGPGGAAQILDISPSTLYSKMKKLGIKQGYY